MKRLFVALLALVGLAGSVAAQGYKSVAVTLKDNTKVEVNLTDELTAKFIGENFEIADGEQNFVIPRANIRSFVFSKAAGIKEIHTDAVADFSNLPAGTVIRVYNTAGALLLQETATEAYSLNLSALPQVW